MKRSGGHHNSTTDSHGPSAIIFFFRFCWELYRRCGQNRESTAWESLLRALKKPLIFFTGECCTHWRNMLITYVWSVFAQDPSTTQLTGNVTCVLLTSLCARNTVDGKDRWIIVFLTPSQPRRWSVSGPRVQEAEAGTITNLQLWSGRPNSGTHAAGLSPTARTQESPPCGRWQPHYEASYMQGDWQDLEKTASGWEAG